MLADLGFGMFNLVPFEPVGMRIVVLYFIIGMAIGGIGSLISVRKHLNV